VTAPESSVPEKVRRMAMSPGIKRLALRESGLKRSCGRASMGRVRRPERWPSSSIERERARPFAAPRACAEMLESEPSMSTRKVPGWP